MATKSDSIDIEQLRAQLDAIYAPAEEQVTENVYDAPAAPVSDIFDQQGSFAVSELTAEAKSHSPNYEVAAKAERLAVIGQHIQTLRQNKLGTQ